MTRVNSKPTKLTSCLSTATPAAGRRWAPFAFLVFVACCLRGQADFRAIARSIMTSTVVMKVRTAAHTTPKDDAFLEYASHGGWSNQILCVINAYFLAQATGRTFVMAPVLPHFNEIGARLWADERFQTINGTRRISSEFRLDYPLEKVYLGNPYVPLARVLDIPYTFPNVSTIDYREFRYQHYLKGQTNLSHWVMEANYTHTNTMFTLQPPNQQNTSIVDNKDLVLRDLATIAEQAQQFQLWTYLDSYYGHIDPLMGTRSAFNIRYSKIIRETAKAIQQEVWNDIPYSSIHLRVGDGFARVATAQMESVLNEHKNQLQQWIHQRLSDNLTIPFSLAIFVATDLEPSEQSAFSWKLSTELSDLQSEHNFAIQIYYSESFQNYTNTLKLPLVYPEIFLDQQLAACSSIVFTPSTNSTFSEHIQRIRNSPRACDI